MSPPTAHRDPTANSEAPTVVDSHTTRVAHAQGRLFLDGALIRERYRVTRLLGLGGFGEVYEVVDEGAPGHRLALKVTRLRDADLRSLDTLRGEFTLLASLSHPNLAKVHDFGHIGDDLAFFTQTLVKGATLDHVRARPDDPGAIGIWAQLCRALEYLHARGILHRDVKPSNVLVDEETGKLTLLDFGISRALGGRDDHNLIGTFAYLPPEAISGGPVDARADLYSLGVTLYRQVMGHVPFRGSPSEVLSQHLTTAPAPLDASRVSAAVGHLILRLLEKDPGARHATAGEVLVALAEANGVELEAEPVESLASYVLSGRFVGQERALTELLLRSISSNPRGQASMVLGEAGSGKSRLLRELRQRVQLERRNWISVRAQPAWPARSVVPSLARAALTPTVVDRLPEHERRELARALPELRRPRERLGVVVDPERARLARIDALGHALALCFEDAPGVLAVEDVHWAEEDVVALLEATVHAARRHAARCSFVFVARSAPHVSRLVTATDAQELCCDALSPRDSLRLVESMFGRSDLLAGSELGDELASRPHMAQHVQESLRLALETGAIVRERDQWVVHSEIPSLPPREVLAARIRNLGAPARQLALAVAVLDGECSGVELAHVAHRKLSDAALALRGLVRAGIVEERTDDRGRLEYAMHDRFREIVLATATPERVRLAHRRAGGLRRRAARGDWRVLLEAAEHFARGERLELAVRAAAESATLAERAGRPDQAAIALRAEAEWGEKIGDLAIARVLHRLDVCALAGRTHEAERILTTLLSRMPAASTSERAEIRLREAQVAVTRGDPARARSVLAQCAELGASLVDPRLLAQLALVRARLEEEYGAQSDAHEHFSIAAVRAEEAGDRALETRAWLGASLSALRLGMAEQASTTAKRSIASARAAADPLAMAEALRALGSAHREIGSTGPALRLFRRAVRAAREAGSPESEAKALNNLGTVCHLRGLFREAIAALERSLSLKQQLGMHASAMVTKNNLGAIYLSAGRVADGHRELSDVVSDSKRVAPVVAGLARSNLGDVTVVQGDIDAAIEHYRTAHSINTETVHDSHALSGLIRTLLMRSAPGDLEEARVRLRQFDELQGRTQFAESRRRHLSTIAMVLDAEGRTQSALDRVRQALRDPLSRHLGYSDVFGTTLEVRWMEAVLLQRLGRTAAARRRATQAARALEKSARAIGDDDIASVYVSGSPLHRAIAKLRLDAPPGSSWPRDA